jgi:hypothetical protein
VGRRSECSPSPSALCWCWTHSASCSHTAPGAACGNTLWKKQNNSQIWSNFKQTISTLARIEGMMGKMLKKQMLTMIQ